MLSLLSMLWGLGFLDALFLLAILLLELELTSMLVWDDGQPMRCYSYFIDLFNLARVDSLNAHNSLS